MELGLEKRRQVADRAVRYLRDDEVSWVQRYWLVDVDALENKDGPIYADREGPHAIGSSATLGRVRQWLSDHQFGVRNRRCGVCAQGALLLALAYDDTIPDDVSSAALLSNFDRDAENAAYALGIYDEGDPDCSWDTLMVYNDDVAESEEEVIRLLDALGNV